MEAHAALNPVQPIHADAIPRAVMSDQIPMPANEEQAVGVCDALSRFCLACRAVVKAYGLSSGHSIIQSPKGGILFRAALFSERRDSRALQLLARWIWCASRDVGYRQAERTSIRESALQEAQRYGPVSYTHLRAHETDSYLVCRLLLEKKK